MKQNTVKLRRIQPLKEKKNESRPFVANAFDNFITHFTQLLARITSRLVGKLLATIIGFTGQEDPLANEVGRGFGFFFLFAKSSCFPNFIVKGYLMH